MEDSVTSADNEDVWNMIGNKMPALFMLFEPLKSTKREKNAMNRLERPYELYVQC